GWTVNRRRFCPENLGADFRTDRRCASFSVSLKAILPPRVVFAIRSWARGQKSRRRQGHRQLDQIARFCKRHGGRGLRPPENTGRDASLSISLDQRFFVSSPYAQTNR